MNKKLTVKSRVLSKENYTELVRSNSIALQDGFVLVNAKSSEVVVKDGNATDMKFRNAGDGNCVPKSKFSIDGVDYRTYLVNENLLKTD